MMIYTHNGRRIDPHVPMTIEDTQYPADWCLLASNDDLDGAGISAIPEPSLPADYDADLWDRIEDWETTQLPYIIYTPKSAEQVAEIRWSRIKVKRDEITDNGGCLVGGKWFHTDPKSKQQQMALTMLGASLPSGLMWKTMDGTFVTMTPTLAAQIFGAQVAREQTIFAHAEALKADINADINAGWPARYEAGTI